MPPEQLTPDEAYALLELLEDKVSEFVDRPYSPELGAAIRKIRAISERGQALDGGNGAGERDGA